MEHVNTLKTYKELMAAGIPEKQAEAQVYALNTAFDNVATAKDLKIMENDLKLFFTYEIVVIVVTIISLPRIAKFIGKKYGWA